MDYDLEKNRYGDDDDGNGDMSRSLNAINEDSRESGYSSEAKSGFSSDN